MSRPARPRTSTLRYGPPAPRSPAGPPPRSAERAARIAALRDVLVARQDEIAATVTAELGAPLQLSQMVHAGVPILVAGSYAELAASYAFEEKHGNSTVLLEPVGVVGAITPWNYPLHQIVAKVAPALAAGCTIVLKPAEDTPLTAQLFAEATEEAGLPAGVFNLVTGLGPVAGQALAAHEDVDLVSFTGSTAVGKQIGATHAAARSSGSRWARRKVRQCHPALRRSRQGRQRRCRQRDVQLRPDVQRLDPDARRRRAVRGGRRPRRRGRRQVRAGGAGRSRRQREAAGPGARLHREGHRGGRPRRHAAARRRRSRRGTTSAPPCSPMSPRR